MATSDYLQDLRDGVDAAQAALASLPDEARSGYPDAVSRLEGSLVYTRVCLDATDPLLVSQSAHAAVLAALNSIAASPEPSLTTPTYHNDLMKTVLELPVARGRELEQTVREAATNYQRSVAQRVRGLEEQIGSADARVAETNSAITQAGTDLSAAAAAATATLDEKLTSLQTAITAQQAALDTQLARHSEAFTANQEERARLAQAQLDDTTAEFDELNKGFASQFQTELASVQKIAGEVGVLAGAIALKDTADSYGDESDAQKKIADTLRYLTMGVTLVAVAVAVWAVKRHVDDTHQLVAKLAISSALGALAGYVATQSGRHRKREVRAKELQLQLTAFSPFIAPLEDDLQQLERVRMTRQTFGTIPDHTDDTEDEDYGPNFISAIKGLLSRDKSSTA